MIGGLQLVYLKLIFAPFGCHQILEVKLTRKVVSLYCNAIFFTLVKD